jgi:catechol 2,3-dioxygenase-like lactoylglutathione lyase family enzyme
MRYLHTMLRTSDYGRTRGFLEALGYELVRELPHSRDGVLEAMNYFFRLPGDSTDVEVSVPVAGEAGPFDPWGHVALAVSDLDATLARLGEQGIVPDEEPYRARDGGPRLCLLAEPACGHLFELVESG